MVLKTVYCTFECAASFIWEGGEGIMRAGLALCGIPLEPVAKAGAFVCVLPINLWRWQLMGNRKQSWYIWVLSESQPLLDFSLLKMWHHIPFGQLTRPQKTSVGYYVRFEKVQWVHPSLCSLWHCLELGASNTPDFPFSPMKNNSEWIILSAIRHSFFCPLLPTH